MRSVSSGFLPSLLHAITKIPGHRALLLLPGVMLYNRLHPEFLRARADGTSRAYPPPHKAEFGVTGQGRPIIAANGLEEVLARLLGSNQFACGGLTLMLVGAAAAGASWLASSTLSYCKKLVMITAEIDSRDDAYRWVMYWLSQHPKFRNSTSLSITTNLNCFGTAVAQQPLGAGSSSDTAPIAYLPAPGDHLLWYQGKWMWISRRRVAGNPQLAANARLLLETLSITILGTSRAPLDTLLSEAAASYHQSQSSRTAVHSCDADGYWLQVGSRPIRPLSTVVLPQGQAESLLSDCAEFLGSEQWYAHHGIPYRRGYLLHGPPGTGKTSLVMALAGALGLEIYVITLSSPTMTDETLRQLLNTAGTKSILLLEDVDAAFVDRTAAAGAASSRLTFSGLLNAIDGVAAQEGRLLFMTTNHIERLNNALIRPGRVDVRCCLGPATRQQARDLFVSFYRDLPHLLLQPAAGSAVEAAAEASNKDIAAALAVGTPQQQWQQQRQQQLARSQSASRRADAATEAAARENVLQELATKFASQLPDQGGVSMAQLQGYLMTYRKDPWAATRSVPELLRQQNQQQQELH